MNPPSVDIKDMLEAYGESSAFDLEFADNMFIGREPAEPDDCITIFDTGGFPPYMGLTNVGYEYPTINIRVRNLHYVDGWNLANRIKDALHGRAHQTWNGTLYTMIQCVNGPALLGYDDHNRVSFFINFNLQRR